MAKYYLLLDNLKRVKAITRDYNKISAYDDGDLSKVKAFNKLERLCAYIDSKHVNGYSYYVEHYLKDSI